MIMEEEKEDDDNPIDFGDELNNLDIPDNAFKKHKGKKNIDNFCETYICVFLVHLVQSLISMGCFYIYYIFKLQIKDFTLYRLISFGLIFLLFILFGLIYYFCESAFYFKHIKCGKYVIFILINILKIVFELPIYISIIGADPKQIAEFYGKKLDELDSSFLIDQLAFPQFEARIYWKVSMVLLYLMYIFYYYFKKEKTTLKRSKFLLLSLIGLLIFFLLLFFSHKNNYDNYRYIYLIWMFNEILCFWSGEIISSLFSNKKHHFKFFKYFKYLDWKINKLDCAKYNMIIIAIVILSHLCYENLKCCTKIINNYINK